MHLIFVHGVPGMGKRTVCTELADLTGFTFMNSHYLAALLGPVLGYSTPAFNELRDVTYDSIIAAAFETDAPGLIATCIFEPSIKLERFERHRERARRSGGEAAFFGLTAERQTHRRRITSPERASVQKATDFDPIDRLVASGYFDFPAGLPGVSMTINTTPMSAAETARHIYDHLPPAMRS